MKEDYLFHWRAIDDRGEMHSGYRFAPDAGQLINDIISAQLLPMDVSRKRRYRTRDWQWKHKIAFIRQLATLLKAGMPLVNSLALLAESHPEPGWQALLQKISTQIAAGTPFSEALQTLPDVFSPLYPALIHVGELTGELDECCLRLAQQQERQLLLQQKIKKALRYPLFILVVALAVSGGMLIFVLPEFVAIYRTFDAPLPAFTASVIAVSQLLQRHAPLLILLSAAAFFTCHWQRRTSATWQRHEQRLLLKLPLLSSLLRGGHLSQIYNTLSLTQHAGLTLLQSLQAVEKTVGNGIWRDAIVGLQQHIATGYPLHQAVKKHGLFTPLCYQLIRVGEESGSLDLLLVRLASWHEQQTHQLADTLAATLEPMMMVIIGMIVGTLVVAMYLPVFGLGNALG